MGRDGVVEQLRDDFYELQIAPNFQRVAISGEETSGVKTDNRLCLFQIRINKL